jgi:hypothetical protein
MYVCGITIGMSVVLLLVELPSSPTSIKSPQSAENNSKRTDIDCKIQFSPNLRLVGNPLIYSSLQYSSLSGDITASIYHTSAPH